MSDCNERCVYQKNGKCCFVCKDKIREDVVDNIIELLEQLRSRQMIENKKLYNGHAYHGVLLQACLDGYQQGTSDGITRVLDILEKIDKEILEKVKDELHEQDYKEE